MNGGDDDDDIDGGNGDDWIFTNTVSLSPMMRINLKQTDIFPSADCQ